MAQCIAVKVLTLLLFYVWKSSASVESEMVSHKSHVTYQGPYLKLHRFHTWHS